MRFVECVRLMRVRWWKNPLNKKRFPLSAKKNPLVYHIRRVILAYSFGFVEMDRQNAMYTLHFIKQWVFSTLSFLRHSLWIYFPPYFALPRKARLFVCVVLHLSRSPIILSLKESRNSLTRDCKYPLLEYQIPNRRYDNATNQRTFCEVLFSHGKTERVGWTSFWCVGERISPWLFAHCKFHVFAFQLPLYAAAPRRRNQKTTSIFHWIW